MSTSDPMSHFTPGPWEVITTPDPVEPDRTAVYIGVPLAPTHGYQHVAQVMGWGQDATADVESQANARAIAALPELIAALADVLSEAEKSGVSNLYENLEANPYRKPTAMGEALGRARAALRQAGAL